MSSHGLEPPIRASAPVQGVDATLNRPAVVVVTRCRQAVAIPGFGEAWRLPDGRWTAVHQLSGEVITATTFERLETIEAPIVRIAYDWPWRCG